MDYQVLIDLTEGVVRSLKKHKLALAIPPQKEYLHFMVAMEAAKHLRDLMIQEVDDMNQGRQDDQNESNKPPDVFTPGEHTHG